MRLRSGRRQKGATKPELVIWPGEFAFERQPGGSPQCFASVTLTWTAWPAPPRGRRSCTSHRYGLEPERVAALVAGRAHRGEHRKPGQAVAFIAHGIPVTRPATIGRGLTRQLPVLVAAVAAGAVRIVAAGALSWLAVEALVLGRGPV